jgi:hypothetical protein
MLAMILPYLGITGYIVELLLIILTRRLIVIDRSVLKEVAKEPSDLGDL